MTIEEMKARKAEMGYTNETIAKLSGVPLGTVQKIFAGETKSPRYDTIQKLTKLLMKPEQRNSTYTLAPEGGTSVMEDAAFGYSYRAQSVKPGRVQADDLHLKPPKKIIGIADGKYAMPPDELLFDDEISDMFDEL